MKRLSKLLMKHKGLAWPWEESHISCLNHINNIAVDALLKQIKALNEETNMF